MKYNFFLFFLFYNLQFSFCQNGFEFQGNTSKVSLPFELINNLIIIPIEVNGVKLNFLLDTGVSETIIFSLDDAGEISFNKYTSIRMKGFGNKSDFEAFRCEGNQLSVKNYVDKSQTIYLVLDQEINISSQVGIPVNGIIGYHFFKNNLIKIDFDSKRLTILKGSQKQLSKIEKRFNKIPMELLENKPYIQAKTIFEQNPNDFLDTKLLIDTGNSDALWLFDGKSDKIKIPENNIQDFLGRGLNGDVFGKRGRILSCQIDKFQINTPITSFPSTSEIENLSFVENRLGSVGSEIMKRFNLVFNYPANQLYLQKNDNFNEPFFYNMSGIEVQHFGLEWTKNEYDKNPASSAAYFNINSEKVERNIQYKFELKPVFIISNVRKNSPADISGVKKDDIIKKINGRIAQNLKLQDFIELLKSEDSKTIRLEIDRKGKIITIKFQLKSII